VGFSIKTQPKRAGTQKVNNFKESKEIVEETNKMNFSSNPTERGVEGGRCEFRLNLSLIDEGKENAPLTGGGLRRYNRRRNHGSKNNQNLGSS